MVYLGHRHCHAKGHPYGRDCVNAFNGQVKHMPTPFEVDFLRGKEHETWLTMKTHASQDWEELFISMV